MALTSECLDQLDELHDPGVTLPDQPRRDGPLPITLRRQPRGRTLDLANTTQRLGGTPLGIRHTAFQRLETIITTHPTTFAAPPTTSCTPPRERLSPARMR